MTNKMHWNDGIILSKEVIKKKGWKKKETFEKRQQRSNESDEQEYNNLLNLFIIKEINR